MIIPVRILMVDDETKVLFGYKRLLMDKFNITISDNPVEALNLLKTNNFAVIITDYKMPKIDGNMFLDIAREISPQSIRIMLTGNADINMAIEAINKGFIFRFLLKPCSGELLETVLLDAIEQYRLTMVEKELLEKTFRSTIRVMLDFLSLTSPDIFQIVNEVRKTAKMIGKKLNTKFMWEIEIASMLSLIGATTLPLDITNKVCNGFSLTEDETEMFKTHATVAKNMLGTIPRLEIIAEAIEHQNDIYAETTKIKNLTVAYIARLLKISVDFVLFQKAYITKKKSYEKLREKRTQYDPDFLITLENEIKNLDEEFTIKDISINDIQPGMILSKDIKDNNNVLIMSKETIVTDILQQKIFSFLKFKRLDRNYKVFVKEYKK